MALITRSCPFIRTLPLSNVFNGFNPRLATYRKSIVILVWAKSKTPYRLIFILEALSNRSYLPFHVIKQRKKITCTKQEFSRMTRLQVVIINCKNPLIPIVILEREILSCSSEFIFNISIPSYITSGLIFLTRLYTYSPVLLNIAVFGSFDLLNLNSLIRFAFWKSQIFYSSFRN